MIAYEVTPSCPRAIRDIAEGNASVTAADDREKTAQDTFVVVVNDHGQRALWRADSALPDGWRRLGAQRRGLAGRYPDRR
jgi:hypothetical protein